MRKLISLILFFGTATVFGAENEDISRLKDQVKQDVPGYAASLARIKSHLAHSTEVVNYSVNCKLSEKTQAPEKVVIDVSLNEQALKAKYKVKMDQISKGVSSISENLKRKVDKAAAQEIETDKLLERYEGVLAQFVLNVFPNLDEKDVEIHIAH